MVRRSPALVRPYVREAQFFQIDGLHESVHHAHRVVRGDHFVQRSGKKAELQSVLSGTVAHGVFVGQAAWRQWLKDSSIEEKTKRQRSFFSQADVSIYACDARRALRVRFARHGRRCCDGRIFALEMLFWVEVWY